MREVVGATDDASSMCERLHRWLHGLERHRFPFDPTAIPQNGLYLLFEAGEHGHGADRVVRVGTHTGQGQLRSRLRQHFLLENKDRSIFRKNIGRALLMRANDPFLDIWELDLTARAARMLHGEFLNPERQREIEADVTGYMHASFSFAVLNVPDKEDRLRLESRLISTFSRCSSCGPSPTWLGLSSPKERIKASGLWQVNELYKQPVTTADLIDLNFVETT